MSFCGFCDDVVGGVKEGLEDVGDALVDVGEDLVDGIVDVTTSTLDALESTVEQAGQYAIELVSTGVSLPGALCEDLADICDAVGLDVLVTPLNFGATVFYEVADYAGNVVAYVVDGVVIAIDVASEVSAIGGDVLKGSLELATSLATLDSDILDELGEFARTVVSSTVRLTLRIVESTLLLLAGTASLLQLGPLRLVESLLRPVPIIGRLLNFTANAVADIVYLGHVLAATLVGVVEVWLCENTRLLDEGPSLHTLLDDVVTSPQRFPGRVKILPAPTPQQPYLVVSDLHMFFPSTSDFFTENGASAILRRLYKNFPGCHLIELGDVEDLWRRDVGRASKNALSGPSSPLSLRRLLDDIMDENSGYYAVVRDTYQKHGRYSRVVGNHDIELMDRRVAVSLERAYPGLLGRSHGVPEFLLIEKAGGGFSHLLFHGHQSDVFNRSGCNWLGRSVTQFAGMFHEMPLFGDDIRALNVTSRNDAAKWWTNGKANDTSTHPGPILKYAQLDEPQLHAASRRLADWLGQCPMLGCGHSHDAKLNPVDGDAPWSYFNSGTAGMAPHNVWCALIDVHEGTTRTRLFLVREDGGQIQLRPYTDGKKLEPAEPVMNLT